MKTIKVPDTIIFKMEDELRIFSQTVANLHVEEELIEEVLKQIFEYIADFEFAETNVLEYIREMIETHYSCDETDECVSALRSALERLGFYIVRTAKRFDLYEDLGLYYRFDKIFGSDIILVRIDAVF